MTIEEPYLHLQGTAFSPAAAERQTGLSFAEKNELGDLGTRGRYPGQPLPFGSATFSAPPGVVASERLDWILDAVLPHLEMLRGLGAIEGWLHSTVYYDVQCNLAYRPDQLRRLAQLGIPYTLSCVHAPGMFGPRPPS